MFIDVKHRPIYDQQELTEKLKEPFPALWEVFRTHNRELFSDEIREFEVRWSSQLQSGVGKTVLRPSPKIALSKPLLLGRESKVMVETLLYEMIREFIYCTTHVNSLRHGEAFIKLLRGINKVTNINVTILDEGGLDHVPHLQTIC